MTTSQMDFMLNDLKRSGLIPTEMRARPLDETERVACALNNGNTGYVIPYFDIQSKPLPFYRTRLEQGEMKYKQVRNSVNHVYFPFGFMSALQKNKSKHIIIVEGEKKAVALQKAGFSAIAFGGVDSWRNRALILPKDTQFTKLQYQEEQIKAAIPAGEEAVEFNMTSTATGFEELMTFARVKKLGFIIVYDTDGFYGVKDSVQRAAASLAYELRHRNFKMSQIKQLILPSLGEDKMGADDFLQHEDGGVDEFEELLDKVIKSPKAFPRHPNPREYLARKLQKGRISRKDLQGLSMALIAELDCNGYRMNSVNEGQMYYFDNESARLMPVHMNNNRNSALQETAFGKILYQNYGIAPAADGRLMDWLGALFASEDPITEVYPHRILARPAKGEDCVRFQISDGQYLRINAKGITIHKNGDDGVLFEAGRVLPINLDKFKAEVRKQRAEPLNMWWNEVLDNARIKERGNHQKLLAILQYVSPWLYRWRGTQLPVELHIGEPGSGKSSLQELRLTIQTGKADLKNAPADIKDWHAALANSGGLHVTDNVQLLNKALRATLSDEICRLITEPQPQVEMRKLYTNNEVAKIKVDNVFVFTAVTQPFMAADLLQRAVIMEFDKSQVAKLTYDSSWMERMLTKFGGREAWLAHHCVVLERFFQVIQEQWDHRYAAKHRLINFEQALIVMARDVFKIDHTWVSNKLADDVTKTVAANDWALEGIVDFARAVYSSNRPKQDFSAKNIADWAMMHDDYKECILLINSRKLGIYIANNKHMVHQITGIVELDHKKANRTMYSLDAAVIKRQLFKEANPNYNDQDVIIEDVDVKIN